MRDIITDEQRRERKDLAAIFTSYWPDVALVLLKKPFGLDVKTIREPITFAPLFTRHSAQREGGFPKTIARSAKAGFPGHSAQREGGFHHIGHI